MEAMPADTNPAAEQRLHEYGDELAGGIARAVPGWVVACVERRLVAYRGVTDDAVLAKARRAGHEAADDVGHAVRDLLGRDLDEQRTTPLALVRTAVRYPTAVLRDAGVPPVVRDPVAETQFPDDLYDLTPATFADLDPALHDIGLHWGAAKAFVHKARHRD